MSIDIICIFLYIPITEIFLLPLKCENGNIETISDTQKCGADLYYLYVIIGIIGALLLFFLALFFLNFYFYPFYESNLLNTSNDLFLLITKLVFILRFIYIKNEYLSITILLLFTFICVVKESFERTYNNV